MTNNDFSPRNPAAAAPAAPNPSPEPFPGEPAPEPQGAVPEAPVAQPPAPADTDEASAPTTEDEATGGEGTATSPEAAESDPAPAPDANGTEDEDSEVAISEPGKVMRIGTMAKQLLEEVRGMELDEAGRVRLAEIYRRTVDELAEGMSSELVDELKRLNLPFDGESAPSAGELRIAQAQLVGWLEGLFHGIQTAIMAQQAIAQQKGARPQGQLPPGMVVVQDGANDASGAPKDDGHSGTGNYL